MTKMSSFLMSYPHMQGSMGTGYEPKFPPTETDFHHLHHHHGGYGMNGLSANHVDYSYHNGYSYQNYTPTPSTHSFYHHHPPYESPQMQPHHPANASSPNSLAPSTNNSYSGSSNSNNNNSSANSSNNDARSNIAATTTSGTTLPVQSVVNGLNVSENAPNVDNNIGYYSGYYSSGHQSAQDIPLQCPGASEPPANTALGLQELGMDGVFALAAF
jgi:hypothetical protein